MLAKPITVQKEKLKPRILTCVLSAFLAVGLCHGAKADELSTKQILSLVKNGDYQTEKLLDTSIAQLPNSSKSELVKPLTALLKSSNWQVQVNAARALGDIGPLAKDAVPAMLASIKTHTSNLHWEVRDALPKIGPAALPEISRALQGAARDDGTSYVSTINQSLAKFGPSAQRIAPSAVRFLYDGANTASLGAFQKMGPACAPAICDGLIKDKSIAYGAMEALSSYGKAAVKPLAAVLANKSNQARRDAAWIFSELKPTDITAAIPDLVLHLKDPDADVADSCQKALKRIGSAATAEVSQLLNDSNKAVISRAHELLQGYGTGAKAAIPTLTKQLSDSYGLKRSVAAGTILSTDASNPAAVKVLEDLFNSKSHYERAWATNACAKAGPGAVKLVPQLIKCLKDSSPEVRVQAAAALGSIGKGASPAVPALLEAIRSTHPMLMQGPEGIGMDHEIHQTAITSLGMIGEGASSTAPELIRLMNKRPEIVKAGYILDAIKGMGKASNLAVLPDLNACLGSPYFRDNYLKIIEMIKPLGTAANSSVTPLLALLKNKEYWHIKKKIFECILSIEPNAARKQEIARSLLKDTDLEIAQLAMKVVSESGKANSSQINDWIKNINSSDMMLQINSIQALGNSGPAAAAAIPVLLKQNIGSSAIVDRRKEAFTAIKKIDPSGKVTIPLLKKRLDDPFDVKSSIELLNFIGSPECKSLAQSTRTRWKLTD